MLNLKTRFFNVKFGNIGVKFCFKKVDLREKKVFTFFLGKKCYQLLLRSLLVRKNSMDYKHRLDRRIFK